MESKSFDEQSYSEYSSIGNDAISSRTMSELNQVFTKNQDIITSVDWVIHTSTIPLSSVVTIPFERGIGLNHDPGDPGTTCALADHCMFSSNDGRRRNAQIVQDNCPCLEHKDKTQICFLSALKSIGFKLDPNGSGQSRVQMSRTMWCVDAQTIFDESYGSHLQKISHRKGWKFLETPDEVLAVLSTCYWFRYCPKKVSTMIRGRPIQSLKSALYNVIQTLDGMLIKLFFCFPLEIGSYRSIAERTARMFKRLLTDYVKESQDGPSKTYCFLKPYFQEVGLRFHSRDLETRLSIINGGLANFGEVARFFQAEFTEYWYSINDLWSQSEIEATDTLSWRIKMSMFCKTRVIGHVPECDAYPSDLDFLKSLEHEPPVHTTGHLRMVATSIPLAMESEQIAAGGLRNFYADTVTSDLKEIIEEIDLDVKPTADTDHTRAEGGKCESGRELIKFLREKNLQIPIRDLESGEVLETFSAPNPGESGYKKTIFWASLQIVCQLMRQRLPEIDRSGIEWPEELLESVFETEVVRINEPGKIRRLVKTSNVINAALAVGSHLLACQLAKGPSHKTGIQGASQSWNFEMRLDRGSQESAFLYERESTILKPIVTCGFQDWSRASDYVSKKVGLTLLTAAHRYVAFPAWYSKFTQVTLGEPLGFTYSCFNTSKREREVRKGWIQNGFMMGLQNTKNILHLIHYSAGFIAEHLLTDTGWTRQESRPYDQTLVRLSDAEIKSAITTIYRSNK